MMNEANNDPGSTFSTAHMSIFNRGSVWSEVDRIPTFGRVDRFTEVMGF